MLPRMGRLWNVATGGFVFLCLSGSCLLPGSNVCWSFFHLGAFLPETIIEICVSLRWLRMTHMCVPAACEDSRMGGRFTYYCHFCLPLPDIL